MHVEGPGLSMLSTLSCYPLLSRRPALIWNCGSSVVHLLAGHGGGRYRLGGRRLHYPSENTRGIFDLAGSFAEDRCSRAGAALGLAVSWLLLRVGILKELRTGFGGGAGPSGA